MLLTMLLMVAEHVVGLLMLLPMFSACCTRDADHAGCTADADDVGCTHAVHPQVAYCQDAMRRQKDVIQSASHTWPFHWICRAEGGTDVQDAMSPEKIAL